MPTIERTSDMPYRWSIGAAPLDEVANVEKMMPRTSSAATASASPPSAAAYLSPLIQGED